MYVIVDYVPVLSYFMIAVYSTIYFFIYVMYASGLFEWREDWWLLL